MPLLFSYGTLQQVEVQLSTFGRRLIGRADALVGFEAARVRIEDPTIAAAAGRTHHANAAFTGNADHRVMGTDRVILDRRDRRWQLRAHWWCRIAAPWSLDADRQPV